MESQEDRQESEAWQNDLARHSAAVLRRAGGLISFEIAGHGEAGGDLSKSERNRLSTALEVVDELSRQWLEQAERDDSVSSQAKLAKAGRLRAFLDPNLRY
jgi:hypothetical protein